VFVPVEKRMVLHHVKEIGRCHLEEIAVKILIAKPRLSAAIADSKSSRSRTPSVPPYRSIWSRWISMTSSRVKNCEFIVYSASFFNAGPYCRFTFANAA
jgi:hypothetical protein